MSIPQKDVSLLIVTYQDVYQWITRQRDGWDDAYRERSAVVLLSPADLRNLGADEGGSVELESDVGAVVVKAKSESAREEGTGFMPSSLYSNCLASYDPSRSRLPNLKHIRVVARPTTKDITPLSDLLVRKPVA